MEITKEALISLYLKHNNKTVCETLHITNPTLISYLKKFDIPLKGKGNRNPKGKLTIIEDPNV